MKRSFLLIASLLGMVTAAACSGSDDGPGSSSGDTNPPGEDGSTPLTDSSSPGADTSTPTADSGGDAPHDAATDARADLSCTGLAYCDDFESYPASTTPIVDGATVGPWKAARNATATMTVDSVKPYGGKNALHIKVAKNDTFANGLLTMTKPAGIIPTNNLFGRAMVYYAKVTADGTDLPNGVHSWIFQGTGPSTASKKTMTLNLANSGNQYFLNYHGDTGASAESSKAGGKPVAAEWVCMQWQYNSSGTPAADEAKVWADGVLALDATKAAQQWDLATPFTKIEFGFTHYQTLTNAIDVYIDDFAIDKAMIPCPAP